MKNSKIGLLLVLLLLIAPAHSETMGDTWTDDREDITSVSNLDYTSPVVQSFDIHYVAYSYDPDTNILNTFIEVGGNISITEGLTQSGVLIVFEESYECANGECAAYELELRYDLLLNESHAEYRILDESIDFSPILEVNMTIKHNFIEFSVKILPGLGKIFTQENSRGYHYEFYREGTFISGIEVMDHYVKFIQESNYNRSPFNLFSTGLAFITIIFARRKIGNN
ncbi:MAG: hypothetical protein INQ03_20260 [Candidatus Heimdallarchaeota archaeon]|nr:hypothetical protein [Candidatus Heimdallarchaeota archaeon]